MILLVSNDMYELPLAVFDSMHDAARRLGVLPSQISHAVHRGSISGIFDSRKGKFVKVEDSQEVPNES